MTLFILAFALGLVFNAAPGPVFAETVRRGIRGGFPHALAVQVGSLAGDSLWAILGLAGVGLLLRLEPLRTPVSIAGVVYLSWLAWDAWRASNQNFDLADSDAPGGFGGGLPRGSLGSGVLLSVTNPQNIAYWAAMGSALGMVGVRSPAASDYAVFFIAFMASSVLWAFVFAALVGRVFRRAGARWARITYRACALTFLALALSALYSVTRHQIPAALR